MRALDVTRADDYHEKMTIPADMKFECYAERLLNPFRGITNTLRYQSAEAVTADGIRWDIYVSNEALQGNLPGGVRAQISDIRYGSWSAEHGLKRGPIFPSEEFRAMEAMGTTVFKHLLEVHRAIPFPFTDRFELWLLDRQQRPLVLLDSASDASAINLKQACVWRPGLNCRKTFTSAVADSLGIDSSQHGAITDYLATYINSRTADVASAQIFERSGDLSGLGLHGIRLDDALQQRRLPAADFPVVLIETQAHDEKHRQLLHDFNCWQAPWLLLLPTLSPELRRDCELHARVQALKIAAHYQLYPDIIDQNVIDSARIEARLRKTVVKKKHDEPPLSPFYLELDPE
jgi:hypothetical protein